MGMSASIEDHIWVQQINWSVPAPKWTNVTNVYLVVYIRGRSQLSTFMKAYREYAF